MTEKLNLNSGLDYTYESLIGIVPKLKDKIFILPDTAITLKQFMDWRKQKVLPPDLMKFEKGKRIRKIEINFFELIWIQIVMDMRKMGLSYPTIRNLKNYLWANVSDLIPEGVKYIQQSPSFVGEIFKRMSDKENVENFQKQLSDKSNEKELIEELNTIQSYLIEVFIFLMLSTNSEFKIAYRFDGNILAIPNLPALKDLQSNSPQEIFSREVSPFLHFSLNLGYYTSQFMSEEKSERFLYTLGLLDENEKELVDVIRKGQLKELVIKFNGKDGKPSSYEIKKDKDLTEEESKKIKEMLTLKDYENITFKSKGNKTVYFEKSITKKLN